MELLKRLSYVNEFHFHRDAVQRVEMIRLGAQQQFELTELITHLPTPTVYVKHVCFTNFTRSAYTPASSILSIDWFIHFNLQISSTKTNLCEFSTWSGRTHHQLVLLHSSAVVLRWAETCVSRLTVTRSRMASQRFRDVRVERRSWVHVHTRSNAWRYQRSPTSIDVLLRSRRCMHVSLPFDHDLGNSNRLKFDICF